MSGSRLTIVEMCTYQILGEAAQSNSIRSVHMLDTDEQLWSRRSRVGTDWEPVDVGWVKSISLISIVNEEGKRLDVNPSEEEQEAIAARIIELRIGQGPAWLIYPGQSFRGQPSSLDLSIRSRSETAKYTIIIYPG